MPLVLPHNADSSTWSGQPIVFDDPSHTEIVWEDLVVQLARENRYGNAREWSVLDHSVLVARMARARGVDEVVCAYLGLHDCAEFVLKDMHPALKSDWYRELEDRWTRHIHHSLGLMYPVPARLKAIEKYFDKRALATEMVLLGDPRAWVAAERWGEVARADLQLAAEIQGEETVLKGLSLEALVERAAAAGNSVAHSLNAAEQALDEELAEFEARQRRVTRVRRPA